MLRHRCFFFSGGGESKHADVGVVVFGSERLAKAAVEAKVNYIDICDDYEATEILFASDIDKAAREAELLTFGHRSP